MERMAFICFTIETNWGSSRAHELFTIHTEGDNQPLANKDSLYNSGVMGVLKMKRSEWTGLPKGVRKELGHCSQQHDLPRQ